MNSQRDIKPIRYNIQQASRSIAPIHNISSSTNNNNVRLQQQQHHSMEQHSSPGMEKINVELMQSSGESYILVCPKGVKVLKQSPETTTYSQMDANKMQRDHVSVSTREQPPIHSQPQQPRVYYVNNNDRSPHYSESDDAISLHHASGGISMVPNTQIHPNDVYEMKDGTRKDSHNRVEKKRRERIKSLQDRLVELVPDSFAQSRFPGMFAGKAIPSKAHSLLIVIDYLKDLQNENEHLRRELSRLDGSHQQQTEHVCQQDEVQQHHNHHSQQIPNEKELPKLESSTPQDCLSHSMTVSILREGKRGASDDLLTDSPVKKAVISSNDLTPSYN